MSRWLPWSLGLVLGLAGCTVPSLEELKSERGAVSAEVSFNFKAGCVAVFARDKAAPEKSSVERFEVRGRAPSERRVTVAILRRDGWSSTLQVAASAYERDCDGQEVASEEKEVSLDRPGVQVLAFALTATDADDDGYIEAADAGTDCDDANAARFPGNPEVCDDFDNDCDTLVNEGLDRTWYRDTDDDGALAEGTGVTACAMPDGSYREAIGQPLFDCDDGDAEKTPGKPELCDGKDNNCAGGIDEAFPTKGTACANDICAGTFICNAAKTAVLCSASAPVSYHPDVDGDGQGAEGTVGTKVCAPNTAPAGTVANATDCDDVDPSARAGLSEVCDAVDNNCDREGLVDEGLSCGGTLKRVVDGNLGGLTHDWRAVAVGPGGLPVWIAGLNGKLVRRGAVGGFQGFSYSPGPPNDVPQDANNCGDTDWYAAWVRPSDGSVFLAGEGGRVAQHNGIVCINQATASNSTIMTGIVGFESGGVTTLYIVNTDGRLFTWAPGTNPVERDNTANVYNGIHALDPNLLLVAMGTGIGWQTIGSYVNGSLGQIAAHSMSSAVNGDMNAVWMGASNLAYAVGDSGAVWRWDGATRWTLLPAPPGGTGNLYGVVTLPNGDAYMVDSSIRGQLYRRTPYGWARGPRLPIAEKPLYGIAMSSERDFWVVGDDGYVFHYPEP